MHYTVQILSHPDQLPTQWDTLLATQSSPTPFMQASYLGALYSNGCTTADTGWEPRFILLWAGNDLYAACPVYIKHHSWGEYVFDQSWANAFAQYDLPYYPKLLCAIPFTPVQGSRLLAIHDKARQDLLHELHNIAHALQISSVHILFASTIDIAACQTHRQNTDTTWQYRHTVQFHWTQTQALTFDDFLKTLGQDKAKKARAEMRKVRDAGVTWRAVLAHQMQPADFTLLFNCYRQTYLEHGHEPYLNATFFMQLLAQQPQHWLLCIASHQSFEGQDFACSLIALDPEHRVAYGRYWGALARVSCLHFDACYYQPLQWCINHGYQRFEGGAQGEHKMARGLQPVLTQSAHYVLDPRFASAIEQFCTHEQKRLEQYVNQLTGAQSV